MRPLLLPLLGILSFSALQPVLAAEPLAAILPDHSKVFFNVSNLSQLRDSKDHPMVKALTTGELRQIDKAVSSDCGHDHRFPSGVAAHSRARSPQRHAAE